MSKSFNSSLILLNINQDTVEKLENLPEKELYKVAKKLSWLKLLSLSVYSSTLKHRLDVDCIWQPLCVEFFPELMTVKQQGFKLIFLAGMEEAFEQLLSLGNVRFSLGLALHHEISNLNVGKHLLDDSEFMQTAISAEYMVYLCGSHRVRHNKSMLIALLKRNVPVYKVLPKSMQEDQDILKAQRGFLSKMAYRCARRIVSSVRMKTAKTG